MEDILAAYKKVFNYDVTFHYVGKKENEEVKDLITNSLPLKNTKHSVALLDRPGKEIKKDIIYLIDDKKAVQNRWVMVRYIVT